MDFSSSKTNWIWAVKSGSALSTNSQSANLQQHSQYDSFNLDLTKARGGNSLNPFADTTATTTTAASASASAGSSGSSESAQGQGASSGSFSSDSSIASDIAKRHRAMKAHGTLMGLAFSLLFPTGSVFMRLFSFRGLVWVHAAFQMFTYAMALAGLGVGVYIAVWPSELKSVGLSICMLPKLFDIEADKGSDWRISSRDWSSCHRITFVPAGPWSDSSFHL